jgi:pectate lyase
VKNQGTAATPIGVPVGYSVDGVYKTWGNSNTPLAAGASVTIGTASAYVIPNGTHTIMAWVNDDIYFAESNTANNKFSQTITVGAIPDTQAPTVPTGLNAVAVSSSQINLSWTASTDNVGGTGYKIYRGGSLVNTVSTTSYSDSGLIAGTSYSYTVAAYDAAGNNSGNSTAVSATTTTTPPPNDSVVQGFAAAAGVTGGAGGQNIVVTNLNVSGAGSLRAAIATSGTRNITFTRGLTGTITWPLASGCTYVDYPNMTIDGAGAHITISGMSLSIHKSNETAVSNVIIRNLTFANNFADRQAILMDYGSSRVWIDHNTFYNNSVGYTGQGVYISDNTGGTTPTYSTVSWNHFKAPNVKSTVIGQRSSITPSGIRTSYHHNWFEGVEARNPKVAGEGVVVHFWNNYVSNWGEYGSGINDGANFWAENNIYETNRASNFAIIPDYGVPSTGPNASYWSSKSTKATGNYLIGNLSVRTTGTFPMSSLTYSVSPEVANNDLKARIMQGAGAH